MKKIRIVLVAATAALSSYPIMASAQEDEGTEAAGSGESAGGEEGAKEGEGASAEGGEAAQGGDDLDKELGIGKEGEEGAGGDTGGLGNICKIDPEACPTLDFDKEAARNIKEPLFAVQQIFVLRVRRFELQPFWGFTFNDQFVSHSAPGVGLNYWITNVLAVGVNGSYYQPFNVDSEFNFETRRAARVNVPLTEYQWGAAFNFTYAPIIGKFSGFGDFIFQYDAYVVGGVGAISTRPIPVIDPDNRSFNFEPRLAFNAGLGIHIFFNRWFAATAEMRDYIFSDQLENTVTVAGQEDQESTWTGDKKLTNNVQAQVGVSIFLPFSFEYRLPK
ncbi:MAG TPA: outer membrane beta-barrel domain-containing protein [Polyangiaceae bacterium]|jgi:outer membrane beta-barrel protein|nr:outer membrane beta-barrel domain-containing protein [Polyangiaceae bacterium]